MLCALHRYETIHASFIAGKIRQKLQLCHSHSPYNTAQPCNQRSLLPSGHRRGFKIMDHPRLTTELDHRGCSTSERCVCTYPQNPSTLPITPTSTHAFYNMRCLHNIPAAESNYSRHSKVNARIAQSAGIPWQQEI